jgi:hypothetical protein
VRRYAVRCKSPCVEGRGPGIMRAGLGTIPPKKQPATSEEAP